MPYANELHRHFVYAMENAEPTGNSVPGSSTEGSSLDTSSSSSRNATVTPAKYQRRAPAPVAGAPVANMRMVAEYEAPITVRSSTRSGGTNSVVSSAERDRRIAATRMRRDAARQLVASAVADEQQTAGELAPIHI